GTSWNKGKRHPTLHNDVVVGAGAKVLGPIEIGEGARIGSNSVIVKAVPKGATVVGIPGHIVSKNKSKNNQNREEIAHKIGFNAYGASSDMPDPIAHAINSMLDHIHKMDKQLESMQKVLKENGLDNRDEKISSLDDCEIKE
ncbi:MAG: serine O-acetyltransferase, partial [Methylococcales bacterium]|nr:serine O-acetyltransferase [Methylococcales bacterium]